jgi:guanylate kinase
MNEKRKGLLLVLSSPSGAGKTTISRKLLERENEMQMSISCTTRKMRPMEIDGKDYYFISNEKFDEMAGNNEFIEHALVFSNKYGTPKAMVEEAMENGRDILFDIDWQGTISLQQKCTQDVVSIFILPPSMEELEKRLRNRAQDDEKVIAERMSKAANEISKWNIYDYVIINNDVEASVAKVQEILNIEREKRFRKVWLPEFINKNLLKS